MLILLDFACLSYTMLSVLETSGICVSYLCDVFAHKILLFRKLCRVLNLDPNHKEDGERRSGAGTFCSSDQIWFDGSPCLCLAFGGSERERT